ncbi:MAG TPA: inorganic phosphate transporter [Chthonomonadaceae bacterium]|nr:inorganic phosphate transporter [Chthonomonadaceae bacterium]
MPEISLIIVIVVISALAFDYINGFHDTANAIATVVSTRVLTPRVAVLMAAVLNFVGALVSQNVAKTVAAGLVHPSDATQGVILAGVIGAIVWNLITWKFGIPSSSSHALIGGLIGAAFVHGGARVVIWKGLTDKVLIPLVGSPVAGFFLGFALMALIFALLARVHPGRVSGTFRHLQLFSAAAMAFSHGSNDAQKSMGIITMALVSHGLLHPADPKSPVIPLWVVLACALAMALGTSAGGWRIIKTMGHRIIRLEPVHGFAAETAASIVIFGAGHLGMPVSTTHVISGSIFGVGASRRLSAVRWGVAQSMVAAWILTLPAAGLVAGLLYEVFRFTALR